MTAARISSRFRWSSYLLGFALGGFFDGILLHQILQWHHLLSTINPGDARFQVAADGYFHALMYVVAAIGIWLLVTSRAVSPRLLLAGMLIGFGAWHVVDSVLSHWLLGIHRIRMDSGNPLLWDLFWFGLFGLAPLIAGWLMRRRADSDRAERSTAARMLAVLLIVGAGLQALWPQNSEFTTVLFAPGTGQEAVFRAVAAVDGEIVWTDSTGELAVIRASGGMSGLRLFREGAILVSGAGLPPGCFNYVRT